MAGHSNRNPGESDNPNPGSGSEDGGRPRGVGDPSPGGRGIGDVETELVDAMNEALRDGDANPGAADLPPGFGSTAGAGPDTGSSATESAVRTSEATGAGDPTAPPKNSADRGTARAYDRHTAADVRSERLDLDERHRDAVRRFLADP